MTTLLQDVRYALRTLRKAPAFSAAVVLTLALGIGANAAIFSVIEAVVLRALPYHAPERIALLADADNHEDGGFLYQDFSAFQTEGRSFEQLAIYYRDSGYSRATLNGSGEPEQVQGAWVSSNLFPLLGVAPTLGRPFGPDEEARRERVVLVSHGLWVRRFGSAPDVIGKSLSINGAAFRIIGVMPATFQFPARDQVFWAPLTTNPYWDDPALTTIIDPRHVRFFYQRWQVVGRLRPGVTVAQAQAESSAILQRTAEAAPNKFRVRALQVVPLRVELSGNTRLALTVLFVAVCCVLLIACSNVANLVLARGAGREREMAIRTALGARRGRLVRQLLTEGFVLAAFAAACGLALAFAGIRALVAFSPSNIPRLNEAGVDAGVLGFAFGLSLLATILFGLGPALRLARSDAQDALSLGTRSATASRALRQARGLLVSLEFALALVLLTGAGLLLRSFVAVESVDPGFEPKHVLTLHMAVPAATPVRLSALHQSVLERLRVLPGVEAAGAIDNLFEPGNPNILGLRAIDGRAAEPRDQWTALIWKSVSGDYFQAIGATLLRGRYFTDQDGPDAPLVAVIDESMARRYWPNQDPIGARIKGQDPRGHHDDWVTIIGVVRDMRRSGLEYRPTPHVFEWYRQAEPSNTEDYVVRTTGDPRALAASLRGAVRALDAGAILSPVTTVDDLLSAQLAPRRFQTWLLGLFSALALLLASVGIYGVMHYSVAQRTHEIGVRVALGARPADILRLVTGEGLRLALLGAVLGFIGALELTPLISNLLFGIRATDPLTFAAVVATLLAVALLACYVPARRAARVDPMEALRCE